MAENQQEIEHFLIGTALEKIDDTNPPTLRQLLRNLLFQHYTCNRTVRQSAHLTIKSYVPVWNRFGIETKSLYKLADKLEDEFNVWRYLVKNKASTTAEQKNNRHNFEERLKNEFDVRKKIVQKRETQAQVQVVEEGEIAFGIVEFEENDLAEEPQPTTSGESSDRKRKSKVDALKKLKETAAKRNRNEAEGMY